MKFLDILMLEFLIFSWNFVGKIMKIMNYDEMPINFPFLK